MLKLLLVVVLFALLTYAAVRIIERRGVLRPPGGGTSHDTGRGAGHGTGRGTGRSQPRRPLGPDDDPDFLRDLERKRRHPEDPDV